MPHRARWHVRSEPQELPWPMYETMFDGLAGLKDPIGDGQKRR